MANVSYMLTVSSANKSIHMVSSRETEIFEGISKKVGAGFLFTLTLILLLLDYIHYNQQNKNPYL